MATKRTPLRRRRLGAAAELAAWSETFALGYDFFGDLADIGIELDDTDRSTFDPAAREAWNRLGAAFLANRDANDAQARPWAEEAFGRPR